MSELDDVLRELNKRFGSGTIISGTDLTSIKVSRIPTGSLAFDVETGGGLPCGRVVELYGRESTGKSSMAMKVVAEAQKMGKVAVWIDVEGTFDTVWAALLGVDVKVLKLCRPETGEIACDILDAVIRSGDCGIVVLDSTAALIPQKELETAMEDVEQLGTRAKMVNRLVRKLHSALNMKVGEDKLPNDCLVVFINQIREKIGVCFTGDTRVLIKHGQKTHRIDSLKHGDFILSYDRMSRDFKRQKVKKVTSRHYNGNIFQIEVDASSGGSCTQFRCTEEHPIYTLQGWKIASKIKKSDKLCIGYQDYFIINADNESRLLSMIIGDGSIRFFNHSAIFRWCHSVPQAEYLRAKITALGLAGKYNKTSNNASFESARSKNIKDVARQMYPNFTVGKTGKKILTKKLLNKIKEEDFVYLYLDDGSLATDSRSKQIKVSFCVKGLHLASIKALMNRFKEFGYSPYYCLTGNIGFNKKDSMIFLNKIKSFVPECMQYKLPDIYRGFYTPVQTKISYQTYGKFVPIKLLKCYKISNKLVYNLEVENSHTYLVGGREGVIVHNCYGSPDTTPGGLGLRHAASVRVEFRSKLIKEGDDSEKVVGQTVNFVTKKNKTFPPQRHGTFDFYTDGPKKGSIDLTREVFAYGLASGIIESTGKSYTMGKEKIVGREASIKFLEENPKLVIELQTKIKEFYFKK